MTKVQIFLGYLKRAQCHSIHSNVEFLRPPWLRQ